MALLNGKGEGGVISSETFNLTRITTVLTGAVAALGAAEVGGKGGLNWAGLDSTQRIALIVAAIAAITLISCADILSRSIATGKAETARLQFLPEPHLAKRLDGVTWVHGQVLAMRLSPTTQLLFCERGEKPGVRWLDWNEVQLYEAADRP